MSLKQWYNVRNETETAETSVLAYNAEQAAEHYALDTTKSSGDCAVSVVVRQYENNAIHEWKLKVEVVTWREAHVVTGGDE